MVHHDWHDNYGILCALGFMDRCGIGKDDSIYAAKGLEFSKVLVFAEGMTKNQRIVACTRAMDELFYFE